MKKKLKLAGQPLKIEGTDAPASQKTRQGIENAKTDTDPAEGLSPSGAENDRSGGVVTKKESSSLSLASASPSLDVLESLQNRAEDLEAELLREKEARADAERRLQEEKERWQLIMQCSQDGVWDIDLETKEALYCSPRFIELTGMQPEGDTFIYDWLKLFHPDDEEAMTFFFNVFSGKNLRDAFQLDHRLFCRSGEYRWFMTRGMLVKNPVTQEFSRLVGISSDIQERKEREELFSYRAMHDVLTDLPNRELFDERFKSSIEFAKRNHSHLAVIMLDLDYFKQVNDTLGHQAGDALLVEIASRLRKSIRESDVVSRFGGDEFAMLLAFGEQEWHGLTKALQRVVSGLKKPIWIDEKKLLITPSMGICIAPDDGDRPKELLKHADDALYFVKSSGRNAYAFWKPEQKYILVKSS